MEARVHQTTDEFREVAWPMLSADPIRYTIILTATANPMPDALLITLHDNENLVGAVIRTEPYPLVVSALPPEAAGFAAEAVHELLPGLPGVSGPIKRVEAFVDAWTARTGKSASRTMATRMFKLAELKQPQVAGAARGATPADLPLIARWYELFLQEAFPTAPNHAPPERLAKATLEPGAFAVIWEAGTQPVSFAAVRGPVSSMSRVAPVYTPAEHRGHGYGSAVTAAATQRALDQGSDHVLIATDLANPTTNHIYPEIGYVPFEDSAEYRFT